MKSDIPESSLLKNTPSDYADSYSMPLNTKGLAIEQAGECFFTSAPAWVDALLILRDKIVGMIGLKTGSDADNKDALIANFKCEVGEQLALFKVFDKNENEVILGEDDKHLDFRVSLFLDRQNNKLAVSTVVKINNWIGKLYLLPVIPFHKIIVPTIVKGMIRQLASNDTHA